MLPVFAVYSTFLQRAYDELIHDVSMQNTKVILAIDRAGVVGEDGKTHQGVFDAAYLQTIPNVTVYSPAYFKELRSWPIWWNRVMACAPSGTPGEGSFTNLPILKAPQRPTAFTEARTPLCAL